MAAGLSVADLVEKRDVVERYQQALARTAAPTPAGAASEPDGADTTWKERLEAQERAALERTYEQAGGNLTKAAELFGVPRTTYREKLLRHGLLET